MNWPIGLRPGLGLTMITWESMSRMWIWAIKNSVWLVVWTIFFVYFSHHIVNFIIPTDVQSIIFRGFAQNHQPEKPFFFAQQIVGSRSSDSEKKDVAVTPIGVVVANKQFEMSTCKKLGSL